MADRVHPTNSPPREEPPAAANADPNADGSKFEQGSVPARPKAGTYVIQVPKDQIYRVPPPENAHLFVSYSRRGGRRPGSPCCRCLAWTLGSLLVLLLALAVTIAILYFVFHPKFPSYSLDRVSIKGLNLSLAGGGPALSPEFDVVVRADNPNEKIGIYYRGGSDIKVEYSDVALCRGSWPVFYQGRRNVTVLGVVLKGSGIRLSTASLRGLMEQQRRGEVPLGIDIKVPVRVKMGAVTSWTVKVKVKCDVVVDRLAPDSKIVSKSCKTKVDVF